MNEEKTKKEKGKKNVCVVYFFNSKFLFLFLSF